MGSAAWPEGAWPSHERNTTALPSAPTKLPSGPANAGIETLHLSINQTLESGSSQNIHLLEDGDIGVIRRKGLPKQNQIPCDAERGTIVIALSVDEDHDEVHNSSVAFRGEPGELLSEAIEVLIACRNALVRVRKS